jgi:hypothetical protein
MARTRQTSMKIPVAAEPTARSAALELAAANRSALVQAMLAIFDVARSWAGRPLGTGQKHRVPWW